MPISRRIAAAVITVALASAGGGVAYAAHGHGRNGHRAHSRAADSGSDQGSRSTASPIKHLVVIYQENVSFDHYFGTYPYTQPGPGDQPFHAKPDTPSVNGLGNPSDQPNAPFLAPSNNNAAQPFLLHRNQAATCDQGHDYTQEQLAFDHGLMDKFVEFTGQADPSCDQGHGKGIVMGYYDGGTTTAMWNYAQNFAMSDNSFSTGFGPSTPGALNLVSGQTHGSTPGTETTAPGPDGSSTVIGDPQPTGDVCTSRDNVTMRGTNVGNLLNHANVTWGWFNGGFRTAEGKPGCALVHTGADGKPKVDYIPHHEPFQYYASTANPQHLPPTSVSMIGRTDRANHQYDLTDFWAAVNHGNMPAVSFLKAPGYEDGHAGYSSPLLEQRFLVDTLNRLQRSGDWRSTAVVIAYDDSDGWYDHQMSPIVNHSQDSHDALSAPGQCGTHPPAGGYQGRCGYGPRQPLLVISPYARTNYVDHSTTDQTSILRFVEDNWKTGRIGDASLDAKAGPLSNLFDFGSESGGGHRLILDPGTGQPLDGGGARGDNATTSTG